MTYAIMYTVTTKFTAPTAAPHITL